MLNNLQKKWGVNGLNMALIITTFALGGSACARVAGWLLKATELEKNFLWWVIYIFLVTLLWPVCVIIISFPLGQFNFFRNYLFRIWSKISGKSIKKDKKLAVFNEKTIKLAVFASGKGTNAENIISYFIANQRAFVSIIFTDNPLAGVIEIGKKYNIPTVILTKEDRLNYESCLHTLHENQIDFIILAGYLKKIPVVLINNYPEKIINIHPALLPDYGGKGMYGMNVHKAIVENKEKKTGITIHLVDEIYDHGKIIFQETCVVEPNDTPESLAKKIHELEYACFPKVIDSFIQKQN